MSHKEELCPACLGTGTQPENYSTSDDYDDWGEGPCTSCKGSGFYRDRTQDKPDPGAKRKNAEIIARAIAEIDKHFPQPK